MNCQVVIESCNGTCFVNVVVSLKQRQFEIENNERLSVCFFFVSGFSSYQSGVCLGQVGNVMSDHSQLSGKLVRETISLLSM